MNAKLALVLALACGASCSDGDNVPDKTTNDAGDADADAGVDADASDHVGEGGSDANGAETDGSDSSVTCAVLDEASCQVEAQKFVCTALYGWKVPDGAKQFVACRGYCLGGAAFTCAVDSSTACWKFPDTCTPEGWSTVFDCDADAAPTCGGAFDGGV